MINKSYSKNKTFYHLELKNDIMSFIHSYIDQISINVKEINSLILYETEVPIIKSNLFNNGSQISPIKESIPNKLSSFPEYQYLNSVSLQSNNFDIFENKFINGLQYSPILNYPNDKSEFSIMKESFKDSFIDDSKIDVNLVNKVNTIIKELDAVIDFKYDLTIDKFTSKLHKKKERPSRRTKYNMYNYTFKQKIISYAAINGICKTSKDFFIPKKSLKRWVLVGAKRKKGGGRKLVDPQMEVKVYDWYRKLEVEGIKPTVSEIKRKAIEYCTIKTFIASNGWLNKFKHKFNVSVLRE